MGGIIDMRRGPDGVYCMIGTTDLVPCGGPKGTRGMNAYVKNALGSYQRPPNSLGSHIDIRA